MKTWIRLEAHFSEELGRTVLFDYYTGHYLFVATEKATEFFKDVTEASIQIVLNLDEVLVEIDDDE